MRRGEVGHDLAQEEVAAGWLGYLVFIGVSIGIVAFIAEAIGGK